MCRGIDPLWDGMVLDRWFAICDGIGDASGRKRRVARGSCWPACPVCGGL